VGWHDSTITPSFGLSTFLLATSSSGKYFGSFLSCPLIWIDFSSRSLDSDEYLVLGSCDRKR
ncbi:19416_t:CDS:2, partial [Cetraspora pellucida]